MCRGALKMRPSLVFLLLLQNAAAQDPTAQFGTLYDALPSTGGRIELSPGDPWLNTVGTFGVGSSKEIKKTIAVDCVTNSQLKCVFDGENARQLLQVTADDVSFSGIHFTRAHSETYGAAVTVISATGVSFTRCDFTHNTAASSGAAVRMNVVGTVTFTLCSFTNNVARVGAAMYIYKGTNSGINIVIAGSYFHGNRATGAVSCILCI